MNLLFLMADELSWWGLNHTAGIAQTPNLDRLRARGMAFANAYTPSPICVSTRAAIACGKYLHEIGYWSSAEAYDGRVPSWGHALKAQGVPVTSIGKLHYRNSGDPVGFDRQIEPIHIPDGIGWVRGLLRKPLVSYDETSGFATEIGPGNSTYLDFDRRVTAAACAWLSTAPERPWATFVSYLSPHYPLIAPERDFALYDPKPLESGPEPAPEHPILKEIAGFFDHDTHFTTETRGIARACYYGLCTFLDRQVGKVLDALEARGQADQTLIIFTSDHGEMLGEKGFWGKSTMYDSAARVPLLLAGPDVPSGGTRSDPVSLIDIAPTIAEAFGAAGTFSGKSLLGSADPSRAVISEYHDGGCSVGITMLRWGRWKYVHYAEGNPPQLFDLETDPTETRDLSPTRPEIIAEARQRMAEFLDPEAVNARAFADQARLIEALGGRAKLEALPQWNYTPADSR